MTSAPLEQRLLKGSLQDPAAVLEEEDDVPKASARAITLNLITGGLGSAIFSLPWSVAGSSVFPSIVLIALVLLVDAWTISIIVRAAEKFQVFDLGSIVAQLGPKLEAVTNICVWASMFLCLVGNIIVMHDSSSKLLNGTALDRRWLLCGLASVFVLPLCFLSQRLLERTSSFAIAVNVYLFLLVGMLYVAALEQDELPEGPCLLGSTLRGNFALVTVMFQAVILQMCVLPMYRELAGRTPEKFDRIVAVAFSALFLLFSGFAIVGYLLFGPGVQSNVLLDLPRGLAANLGQAATVLVVACVYPIMLSPMTAPLEHGRGDVLGMRRGTVVAAAKCVIVAMAMFAADAVTSLGLVNAVNGALSALVFVAVLPSAIGLLLLEPGQKQRLLLRLLLVVGAAAALLGLAFSDNYVADLACSLRA